MSGFAPSFVTASNQKEINQHTTDQQITEKTSSFDQLKKSVYSYLNLNENPYENQQENTQKLTVPWIRPASDIFEWWIRVIYNGTTFEKQLNVSATDFQNKFLKHPYYSEDAFFNIDNDPEDDLKVSFGFYWETILNTKTNEEYKSLEDMVRVRQINSGPSNLYAGLEVWSEIHVNWKLVNAISENTVLLPQSQQFQSQVQKNPLLVKFFSFLMQLLQRIMHHTDVGNNLLQQLLENTRSTPQYKTHQNQPIISPKTLTADDDYFSVGVGYRTAPGDRIPLYVEKRFAFAKDNIFNPAIFQQIMITEPSGTDPLELLYGFQAYNGSTHALKYDIAFSVQFSPFVTLTTQFIPLGGYIYYHFDTDSEHDGPTTITYSSDIHVGDGNSTSLSLVFDKIDGTMAQTGRWMSFGLRKDPHGFDYEANAVYDVSVIVDSPWFSQKVKIDGLPKTLSYEWKIFDDFNVTFIHGELFYVNIRGYADVTMSSPINEIVVYYPKLKDPNEADVPFLTMNNIPSSQRLEAKATLTIQNGSMLLIDVSGYIDLTKSGPLGDITIFYPKANPDDPDVVLMNVPRGNINSQRISAEATLYVDPNDFNNTENYVYGMVQRQADSNFHEMDFYLPSISTPIVQITDIPAQASITGTFWWNQLRGSGRAERSSANQNPDPIHFNIAFDTLTFHDILSIGDGHAQTDFMIANDGYLQFDTSHDALGNSLSVSNAATGNSVNITAGSVSAQNFAMNWGLNTSGPQLQVDDLALSGTLNTFHNFTVAIEIDGKSVNFSGDWSLGESGGFSIDVHQAADVRIDLIHLDNYSGRLNLDGYVVLSNTLHYDMSWKWKQGSSLEDPGYFKINEGTNEPNLKTIAINFTYMDDTGQDRWGANVTLSDFAVYICVEWYWQNGFHLWPVIEVSGDLNLAVLLNYNWYPVWP